VAVLQYIVEQYAKAGENINRQDFKRRTGIYNACRLGHIASVRRLYFLGHLQPRCSFARCL
jgi:hypothetical protein